MLYIIIYDSLNIYFTMIRIDIMFNGKILICNQYKYGDIA